MFSFSFGDLLLLGCGAVCRRSFQDTCCLTFHTSTMQKTSTDLKIEQKQNTKNMVFATLSQKCYQKTRTKNIGKRKHRNVLLLTKTSQNTGFSCFRPKNPPKHKRHTPRGRRRTCYLVLVVPVLVLVLVLVVVVVVVVVVVGCRCR